jgi:HEAT repeats
MPEEPALVNQPRSRRLYILWAIALTLLLSLGLFCWLVVVPVWRVHAALQDLGPLGSRGCITISTVRETVERIGGQQSAGHAIRLYLQVPRRTSVHKRKTALLLRECTPDIAVPTLINLLEDADYLVRADAMRSLGGFGPAAATAVPMLKGARHSRIPTIRRAVAETLGEIGHANAVPVLEEMLKDAHPDIRASAAEALKKIKAKQEKR